MLVFYVLMMLSGRPISSSASANLGPSVLEHISASNRAHPRHSVKQTLHQAGRPQLSQYVTLLPTPPQPAEWVTLCQHLEARGAAALQDWVQQEQCLLPDIQGSLAASCQLGRRPWAFQFNRPLLAAYAAGLFHSIVAGRAAAAKLLGAPAPELTRWDLWHGHFFIAASNSSTQEPRWLKAEAGSEAATRRLRQHRHRRQLARVQLQAGAANASSSQPGRTQEQLLPKVGILFHAAEYPLYDPVDFPFFLGHCQHNSTCTFNARAMDVRNIVWFQGKLAVLDVGVDSPLHALLHEGTEPLCTVYEESFGQPLGDLLLLREPRRRRRSLRAAMYMEQQRWHRLLAADQAATACSADGLGVYVSF